MQSPNLVASKSRKELFVLKSCQSVYLPFFSSCSTKWSKANALLHAQVGNWENFMNFLSFEQQTFVYSQLLHFTFMSWHFVIVTLMFIECHLSSRTITPFFGTKTGFLVNVTCIVLTPLLLFVHTKLLCPLS